MSSEMKQTTSKADATAKNKSDVKGKRFGRGAVESGLTHECGVFGVVGAGAWPTNVTLKSTPVYV